MPRKRTASSSLDPKAFFKQFLGAAVQAAANGPAGRINFSQTIGRITDGFKHEAETAMGEFKAHVQQIRRSLPPMKVRVLLADDLDWTAEPIARIRIEALRASGFQELGGFRLDTIPTYSFVGFIHAEQAAQAQVTRTGANTVLEMSSLYTAAVRCVGHTGDRIRRDVRRLVGQRVVVRHRRYRPALDGVRGREAA